MPSKAKVKTATFWEVCESRNASVEGQIGRPGEYGRSQEDFRDRRDAEEYAREIGYGWVKEIAFVVDDEGVDYERECHARFYRVKRSVITAHVRCCRCGQGETFKSGVLAYDWKFEHELMHDLSCVEAWETDLAYPGETFPLRKRVNTEEGSTLVQITDTPEPEPQELLSIEDED